MNPGLVIKLRPTGPWRIGPDSGARNQVDAIYHSDSLYSAVTSAMMRLGMLEEWLGATAANGQAAVTFSSCFPFLDEIGFVVPPRTVWPPSSPAQLSARVRWKSARFVPLGIVQGLLSGQVLDETQWAVDGVSACLVPSGKSGPFRSGVRFNTAVDRLTGAAERHSVACVEFSKGAGLWTIASFADESARNRWLEPLKTAFRVLADSGFGGERSRGWGRAESPEFTEGPLPDMILVQGAEKQGLGIGDQGMETQSDTPPEPELPVPSPQSPISDSASSTPHWLLSLFIPAPSDSISWDRGDYSLITRGGHVDSAAGAGELKKQIQMVAEGSVVYATSALRGSAPDVAPDGFPHPVYRAGFALSIALPEVS
jgi:CRISPR type III-A-associated RAMP protein Csm4